jgi:8-oxo-dGTP pyrophosphatase MutT (NUDIX family)
MAHHLILEQIRLALGTDGIGRFCFICGAAGVTTAETATGEIFVCHAAGHRSPRAYLFDGKAKFSFEKGELIHEAVGAIIRRQAGKEQQTLLFLRRKFPYQYTIPAGHVEVGQTPEAAMRREVKEETGLTVRQAVRLWPEEKLLLTDPCRRGANIHRWHMFEAAAEGKPCLSEEGRIIGWYNNAEIQDLAARDLLTAPVHTMFVKMGLFSTTQ